MKFEEVLRKASDVAQSAINSANGVAQSAINKVNEKADEIERLENYKNIITSHEAEIESIYRSLGVKVLESGFFAEEAKKVETLKKEIKTCESEILAHYGLKKCEACEAEVSIDSNFCPNCGAKINLQ